MFNEGDTGIITFGNGSTARVRITKVSTYSFMPTDYILTYEDDEKGLVCSLIIDAGLTEFGGVPTRTCIAIGPNWSDEIDEITGHLKLL